MGLDVGLVDPVRPEVALDRHVGGGQCGRGVARHVALPVEDVGREILVIELGAGATDRRVGGLGGPSRRVVVRDQWHETSERAVGMHGRGQIHDSRQPLELDHHKLCAIRSGRFRFGHHERHRLPGEQRLTPGQRLEHPHVVGGDDRQIGGRQNRHDTRDRQGCRRIDPEDPGVGIEARYNPGV